MEHSEETWADIPNHSGYEVSTLGGVRSWRGGGETPKVLKPGNHAGGHQSYRLDGIRMSIDDIMAEAFGEDEDWALAFEREPDELRDLTRYELNEIRLSEGYKAPHKVGAEFRITSQRVLTIWDGGV